MTACLHGALAALGQSRQEQDQSHIARFGHTEEHAMGRRRCTSRTQCHMAPCRGRARLLPLPVCGVVARCSRDFPRRELAARC